MNKEIKYIGFYDLADSVIKRVSAVAATNKMDYICSTLNKLGFNVHLVSPSWFADSASDAKYKSQITLQISREKRLTLGPSIGTHKKWTRNLKIVMSLFWLFFWLILHVNRNDKILAYHSPWLSIPIRWAKFIKKFKLILEVEEVYGDISSIHPYFDVLENKLIFAADYYLFSTELLAERIATIKPYIIVYGTYQTSEKIAFPPEDGKIHLLYAGIIDKQKAGAFNAIECARFLPDNYVLHIIGFGDTELLIQRINEINSDSKCKVVYDGLKSGRDYIKYCQSCHIGLSTQKMHGKYLETSFPSKILSYLSLGLNVVSCYVDCVAESQLHPLMNYYLKDTAESLAEAIQNVDINNSDKCKKIMYELDKKFVSEFNTILNNE